MLHDREPTFMSVTGVEHSIAKVGLGQGIQVVLIL